MSDVMTASRQTEKAAEPLPQQHTDAYLLYHDDQLEGQYFPVGFGVQLERSNALEFLRRLKIPCHSAQWDMSRHKLSMENYLQPKLQQEVHWVVPKCLPGAAVTMDMMVRVRIRKLVAEGRMPAGLKAFVDPGQALVGCSFRVSSEADLPA